MENRPVLRAVTPAAHPLITASLAVSLAVLAGAVALAFAGQQDVAIVLAPLGIALFVGAVGVYLFRLRRVERTLSYALAALDVGDLERARTLVAPLVARAPDFPQVAYVAGEVLYTAGDPLSATTFWERAMKRLGPDAIAPRLVAAYAALNRAGDARRVAALASNDPLARLALAWSELVALGGDRARGRELADSIDLGRQPDLASSSERAMWHLIVAIAHASDRPRSDTALAAAQDLAAQTRPIDRAFLEYLEGVARRERGERDQAIATFERAMATLPESIGAALARRERSHLLEP